MLGGRISRPAVGLAAIVVAFIGIGVLFALQQPPFVAPDEIAHLGYAHEIAAFHLPEITTTPDIPEPATQWRAEADSRKADVYRQVWVANHPPLSYVVVAPLVWISSWTDRPDGGLLYLRLANVAFAAVGVMLTYALAKELSGGNGRIGLAAAALAGSVSQGHIVFSQALNDGLAFAAGTAVVWAGIRVVRRGGTRADLVRLAVAAAVASGARAATMLIAAAVVIAVAAIRAVDTSWPFANKARAALPVAATGVPAAVLWGWFYVRNIVIYGDIGASQYLLDMFGRRPQGSALEMATRGHMWVGRYQLLFAPSTLLRVVPPMLTTITALVGVGAAAAFITGRTGSRDNSDGTGSVSRRGVAVGLVAVAMVAATVAQHASGGGNPYSRYLLPALGVLAAFGAIGADRLVPRAGPVVLVVLLGWWAVLNIPVAVDPTRALRPRDGSRRAPIELQVLPGSDGWRLFVACVVGVGCVTGLLISVWVACTRTREPA